MVRSRLILATSILVMAIIGFTATPASALRPDKEHFKFSGAETNPAGTLCDFTYHVEFSITAFDVTFFNDAGDVVRDTLHGVATITHMNRDTGYTLTETDVINATTYEAANFGRTVGIQWHLRDPDGKNVLTVAGLVTYHLDPFEIIRITPRVDRFFDFPEVICPLLGGSPA